eukprot:TRINITY_DN53049_c0_g1_i1.p1 TRINITY_DN53049_c0_g1~~TRINITY_DN53049_c0_g1_i1.p1  ORF type:complete len:316 (-),score=10.90 TRINITY_DN53049_c0_g1_i1:219-1166(-)
MCTIGQAWDCFFQDPVAVPPQVFNGGLHTVAERLISITLQALKSRDIAINPVCVGRLPEPPIQFPKIKTRRPPLQPSNTPPLPPASHVNLEQFDVARERFRTKTRKPRRMLQIPATVADGISNDYPNGCYQVEIAHCDADGVEIRRRVSLLDSGAEGVWQELETTCQDAMSGRLLDYRFTLEDDDTTYISWAPHPQDDPNWVQAELEGEDFPHVTSVHGLGVIRIFPLPGYFESEIYAERGEEEGKKDVELVGMGVLQNCVTILAGTDAAPMRVAYHEAATGMKQVDVAPGTVHFLSANLWMNINGVLQLHHWQL